MTGTFRIVLVFWGMTYIPIYEERILELCRLYEYFVHIVLDTSVH